MKSSSILRIGAGVAGLAAFAANSRAASFEVDFQATIASEQHPDYGGEARFYHVSVNPNNPGIGSFASTIVGTNDPAGTFTRAFTEDVVAYAWVGGTNNVPNINTSGGDAGRIAYTTPDTEFDGFGQNQLKLWITTDPGADIATGGPDPFSAVPDVNGNSHRSFGGAVGTVDITGLTTGSVYVFYGAFNATPTLSAVMKDTDGGQPDITITDAHLNGDRANRTEYYVAQLKFVNDAGYDVIEYEHLANGVDYTGNGRGIGTLLTGSTGPTTPPTFPITKIERDAESGAVTLTFESIPDRIYNAETSTDLVVWDPIMEGGSTKSYFGGAGATTEITDMTPPSGDKVFYRVIDTGIND